MITVLGMGQSNAQGRGVGGDWTFPASVTVWNNLGEANTGFVGNAFVAPTLGANPFSPGKNNGIIHACRYLAQELNQDVRLILVAYGGQPIQEWSDVDGAMYTRMKAVLAAAGVVTPVDLFDWHHAEANILNYSTYQAAFSSLLAKMTTDGIITVDTPIVIGELANQTTFIPNMNAVLRSIADASARIGIADIACFPANDQAIDILHFNGPSLVRMGLEYARETMKLPGPLNFAPAETDFPYVTAAGILSYKPTIGKPCVLHVKAENGKKSLIYQGGFKADRLGVYRFDLSAISFTGSLNIVLLDWTGAIIQYLAGVITPSISHCDASTVVALGKDDRVYMGIIQNNPTPGLIAAQWSSLINRMTVQYLGRN